MSGLPTLFIVLTTGVVLASLVQYIGVPAWAAFMLGLAYLLLVSLVLNSIADAQR